MKFNLVYLENSALEQHHRHTPTQKTKVMDYRYNCTNSDNKIIKTCSVQAYNNGPSCTNTNVSMICSKYRLDRNHMSAKHIRDTSIESNITTGKNIRELIIYRNECDRDDKRNITEIIDYLCLD